MPACFVFATAQDFPRESSDEYPKGYSFGTHFNSQFGLLSHVYL
jgi:hypothetical protein